MHQAFKDETALVVFSGATDLAYLKWLKPGFRHCFVILKSHDRWISIDPLAHMTRVDLHDMPSGSDPVSLLTEQGLTVLKTQLREAELAASAPMLCTCVEAGKRILGIQSWRMVTPWQRYRHLSAD